MTDTLGDRIKRYEATFNPLLTTRTPLFIRVDGRAFHTFTRGFDKPFDTKLIFAMQEAALRTAREMQGFKLAYCQSDEVTFMLTDYDTLETQPWFGYELNKVVSLSASIFTAHFNWLWRELKKEEASLATFDARAFNVPIEDAPNVFIWRQRDWERNSLQMLARAHFSHKELHKKNSTQIKKMLKDKGESWDNLSRSLQHGHFITKEFSSVCEKQDYDSVQKLLTLN